MMANIDIEAAFWIAWIAYLEWSVFSLTMFQGILITMMGVLVASFIVGIRGGVSVRADASGAGDKDSAP